jgi:hypothetical protein
MSPTTLFTQIKDAYYTAMGNWTGVQWTEMFGPFNAEGLTGHEDPREMAEDYAARYSIEDPTYRLYAEARNAVTYATQCRRDAAKAEEHAKKAFEAAEAEDWPRANQFALSAASLESIYGDSPTWGPLYRLCHEALQLRHG